MSELCSDCGCVKGQLHEIFCTNERCPFCNNQLVSCGCISEILSLNSEEQLALDEYIDDEAEPLKSINERWVKALAQKGRRPF
ncbi:MULTISPECIES: hypothetical protein [Deefgea]|uniref:Uncharacterized protein n=1 Tax=Deefgea chitinilytica TaxID=570276 RepID=A0ABS2CET2_9NEIS|nr:MULTISPECIES: hypothetical protein [Deefgea]MBM5572655.1 hypothetical protein [Deefgea chitinilytica]MBM9889891.1 hypothetical protein [Deefgea sp. CFH1-16]